MAAIWLLIITQVIFSIPAPLPFLRAVWDAGGFIAFVGTIVLGAVAYWQTKKAHQQAEKAHELNEKQLKAQEKSLVAEHAALISIKDIDIEFSGISNPVNLHMHHSQILSDSPIEELNAPRHTWYKTVITFNMDVLNGIPTIVKIHKIVIFLSKEKPDDNGNYRPDAHLFHEELKDRDGYSPIAIKPATDGRNDISFKANLYTKNLNEYENIKKVYSNGTCGRLEMMISVQTHTNIRSKYLCRAWFKPESGDIGSLVLNKISNPPLSSQQKKPELMEDEPLILSPTYERSIDSSHI